MNWTHRIYLCLGIALFISMMSFAQNIHLGLEQGMRNGYVRDMTQDAQGRIWMATEGGLHCWDGYRFTIYDSDNSPLVSNELNTVLADADKRSLWVGTQREGLCRLDLLTGKWDAWRIKDGLSANGITHLAQALDGGIWITCYLNGVDHRSPDGTFTNFSTKTVKGFKGCNRTSLESPDGRYLYVGHDGRGMSVIDLKLMSVRNFRQEQGNSHSLAGDDVNALAMTPDGLIWIGTNHGISIFSPTKGEFIQQLPAKFVSTILRLSNGKMEYGTFGDGKQAIMEDRRRNLWVSDGRRGVNVTFHEQSPFTKIDTTWTKPVINGIEMVQEVWRSENELWVGTVKGLWHVGSSGDIQEMTQINKQLAMANIISLTTDRRGRLWLGTFGSGLYIFEPDGRLVTHHLEVPSVNINTVFRDSKGRIWVGSRMGLALFEDTDHPENVRYYGREEGLHDLFLRTITEDKWGCLWISCNSEILRLNPTTDSISIFSHTDGIPYGEFQNGAVYTSNDGKIVFGLDHGACGFYPQEALRKRSTASFFISDFTVFRKSAERGDDDGISLPLEGEVWLNHDENSFCIRVGVADIAQADAIIYQYKMEGLDEHWFSLPNNHELTLHSVPPGKYTFRLRARLPGNNWSLQEVALPIHISQPLWWTWWARLVYVVLALLFAWYEWHQYQQRLSLRRQLNERLAVLYATTPISPVAQNPHDLQGTVEAGNDTEHYFTKKEVGTEDKNSLNIQNREFLEKLDNIILNNLLEEKLDLQFLTDRMFMSHSTLYRRVKALTGMTVNEYVRRHRVARAMQLLRTGATVSEVALQCGFNSTNYFRRCFKAEYGILPSEV